MAYEVTKQIRGHAYRYRVEGMVDAATGKRKQKWSYLGRIDASGVVAGRQRPAGDARERIVEAMIALLENRDISHLTIGVIARAAKISRPTFYRCFADREAALDATIRSVHDRVTGGFVRFTGPIGSLEDERLRMRSFLRDIFAAIRRQPGVHRAMALSPTLRQSFVKVRHERVLAGRRQIGRYIDDLRNASLTRVPDSLATADAIVSIALGVHTRIVYDAEPDIDLIVRSAEAMVDGALYADPVGL